MAESNISKTIAGIKAKTTGATDAKVAAGESALGDLRTSQTAAKAKSVSRHSKRMRRQGRRELSSVNSQISAQEASNKALTSTDEYKRGQDLVKGAEFGGAVLGEEGLGRLGTDTEVQETLGRFKDIADKGLSRQELAAERAQATRSIDSSTQTASRGLQAKLAKMGVKGSVAGQQLVQAEMQGAQQKADLSQNLFLKSEQIKREGLKDFSQRQGDIKTFDLGQSAKEKDIIMQSGLGFAQMGSSERTAKYAAEQSAKASVASARASKPSCFVGSTLLKDLDGKEIKFEDLQPGIMLKDNNLVMGVSKHLAVDDLYYFKGTKVTGCHFVFSNGNFVQVKNAVGAEKIEYDVDEVYVYNIITSSGVVEINNELFSDWNDDDLVEEHNAKVQGLHLREVQ